MSPPIKRLPKASERIKQPSLHALKALLRQHEDRLADMEERQEQLEEFVLRLLKRLAEKG